nr:MAG TPA: hypothetical protein [Caudoviricetes sp.]
MKIYCRDFVFFQVTNHCLKVSNRNGYCIKHKITSHMGDCNTKARKGQEEGGVEMWNDWNGKGPWWAKTLEAAWIILISAVTAIITLRLRS